MSDHDHAYASWKEPKPALWWRALKSLLILALPIGILAFAAVPLAVS